MASVAVTLAKLAAIRRAVDSVLEMEGPGIRVRPIQNFAFADVGHYFTGAAKELDSLRGDLPEHFGDFEPWPVAPLVAMVDAEWRYSRVQLERLRRDIDQILEIRANSELAPPAPAAKALRRVFITHGRSSDWREVQAFLEKDIGIGSMELAQEPSLGMTVIEKLLDGSARCDSAVIVMTGDDIDSDGIARARENVMHEIGFFQGVYGRSRVCLLHEDGVSIPSNLTGVVYIPFPKGAVAAGFHVLARELRAIYSSSPG